ncbi:MAG: nickel-dependent hydrogenase large subunit [Nitrospinales bacterium]
MATITVMDPVTRIEGHLKVEITVDNNKVSDARCTGTLFRGFEILLKQRNPLDAAILTQRICGVCPISHGQASVLALEDVSNWRPTTNGRLMRNLTLGSNFIQSHILHFYLLAAMDFIKGPDTSPWAPAWDVDISSTMTANSGLQQVYKNFTAAIGARRDAHEMGAVFGGRMPTSHAFVPGGFTAVPTNQKIDTFGAYLNSLTNFIKDIYIPDVERVAAAYPVYWDIGKGPDNLLAYGVFETDDDYQSKLFPPGFIENGESFNLGIGVGTLITESVTYSWYKDTTNNLNPDAGDTQPVYPKGDAYSWLKAPRLNDQPFEVGPLARMKISNSYAGGISVMDRHMARAQEALKIAEAMKVWLNDLNPNSPVFDDAYDQYSGTGVGLTEAPRGALGHWIQISNGKIDNYQVITPTCWNSSPMDDGNVHGPMEQALIGTPIMNADQPIEALRVIHSFDPCLSCAVHILKPNGKVMRLETNLPSL